jgi:hypothetical protein
VHLLGGLCFEPLPARLLLPGHSGGVVPKHLAAAAVATAMQTAPPPAVVQTPARPRGLPSAGLGPIHAALTAAVAHNPYVGEPRLMLAQLGLIASDWPMARDHAAAGLALLQDWGVAWDKRIAWSGWVSWARILVQSAEAERWPETLAGLNGLGLVTEP